jgi:hypothetical protein
MFWHPYKTNKYATLAERGIYNVERDGWTDGQTERSNSWALNGKK